jgi:hypothetical protein
MSGLIGQTCRSFFDVFGQGLMEKSKTSRASCGHVFPDVERLGAQRIAEDHRGSQGIVAEVDRDSRTQFNRMTQQRSDPSY